MITSFYAGFAGIIYLALSIYVIRGRFKAEVSLGNGNNKELEKRIRCHANFIEYAPLVLILMALIEYQSQFLVAVHAIGIMLIIGRLLHPIGLMRKHGASFGRSGGMVLTFTALIIASFLNLYLFLVS